MSKKQVTLKVGQRWVDARHPHTPRYDQVIVALTKGLVHTVFPGREEEGRWIVENFRKAHKVQRKLPALKAGQRWIDGDIPHPSRDAIIVKITRKYVFTRPPWIGNHAHTKWLIGAFRRTHKEQRQLSPIDGQVVTHHCPTPMKQPLDFTSANKKIAELEAIVAAAKPAAEAALDRMLNEWFIRGIRHAATIAPQFVDGMGNKAEVRDGLVREANDKERATLTKPWYKPNPKQDPPATKRKR